MEQKKEAVDLINDERYLHLRENGAGVGFATYNKVTGEPLESGQISEKNLPPDGVYIFDEPEAALSPQRQLTLLINIYRCAQEGAQFIIVSHSPILLGMPDAEIFSFDNGTIHPCQYEDTDSYVITKTFVNNRQHFLNQLLNEET